jgi:hypothetical protein
LTRRVTLEEISVRAEGVFGSLKYRDLCSKGSLPHWNIAFWFQRVIVKLVPHVLFCQTETSRFVFMGSLIATLKHRLLFWRGLCNTETNS